MEKLRIGLAGAGLAIAALVLYPVFGGGASAISDEQLQEIVYVDTETGETFLLRARSSPEIHPGTGDPTLVPGLYCEKCKAWKAVGSMEMLQSNHGRRSCPVHRIALSPNGPLPDEISE